MNSIIKILAFVFSILIFLATVFELQYSLILGPIFDVLALLVIFFLGLIFSIAFIFFYGVKKLVSYAPIIIILISFTFFLFPKNSLSHQLHYNLNKSSLEKIENLSLKSGIHEMSDFLRYSKRIDESYIGDSKKLSTKTQIKAAFGDYMEENNISIDDVFNIQQNMIKANIISLHRDEEFLVLAIDGFIDNEYGYIKSYKGDIKLGDGIPPFGFTVVRIIELKNGWYFYYST